MPKRFVDWKGFWNDVVGLADDEVPKIDGDGAAVVLEAAGVDEAGEGVELG